MEVKNDIAKQKLIDSYLNKLQKAGHDDIVKKYVNHTMTHEELTKFDDEFQEYRLSLISTSENKFEVILPGSQNRMVRDFAVDVAQRFDAMACNGKDLVFFRPLDNTLIEIDNYTDKVNGFESVIYKISEVDSKRLVNIIETNMTTVTAKTHYTKGLGEYTRTTPKTMSTATAELLSKNDDFRKSLSQVNRFFTTTMPFLRHDKLFFPKRGYCPELNAYFAYDKSLEYKRIDKDVAKLFLQKILSEFCFKEEIDRVMAMAMLLTPACRGLYKDMASRTPLFMLIANRERCGKDYLAGVVGLTYEGFPTQDSPLGGTNTSDELRKKITGAMMDGRKRMHFANCKGNINNDVLEQVLTNTCWIDRRLGNNDNVRYPNELEFSLSGNSGITYTADLFYRARIINLFLSIEDPNKRTFTMKNLWGYVRDNRGAILSAIFSLIEDWYEHGSPRGKTLFASYPEWAEVVGGIMTYHGLGDPCVEQVDDNIGGDIETTFMKEFYNFMAEQTDREIFTPSQMMDKLRNDTEAPDCFFDITNNDKGGTARFGKMIRRYCGRTLGGITMREHEKSLKTCNIKYIFVGETVRVKDKNPTITEETIDSW